MNISTYKLKDNKKKHILMFIPSFEIFYKSFIRIVNECDIVILNEKGYMNYNFDSDIVKNRFEKFYNENIDNTVNLKKIACSCNSSNCNYLSKDFYLERGWDEEYAKTKISEIQTRNSIKSKQKMTKDRLPSQIGYWLKKGYSEEESKEKVSERQRTFSKELCIKKYGLKEGKKKFKERQTKWQKTLSENYTNDELHIMKTPNSVSKESLLVFNDIFEEYKDKFKIYFGDNEFHIYDEESKSVVRYDFTVLDLNLIFEYNGEKFHPDYRLTESELKDWKQLFSEKSAQEVKDRDNFKKTLANKKGFKVIYLWSLDGIEYNKSIVLNEIQASLQSLQQ